jgi:hypothetical protein
MRINLVALCYRGSYFYRQYGPAIRDLQIALTLSKIENVSVTVLERPISIPERALGKTYNSALADDFDVAVHDYTSWDVFGPAFRRLWFERMLPTYLDQVLHSLRRDDSINIFLDFMPVGAPNREALAGWFYWYDFIDNFTKHNRFNKFEQQAAFRKYQLVKRYADRLTFVTEDCRRSVDPSSESVGRAIVLTNKVFTNSSATIDRKPLENSTQLFDFGFIGFVTDKIDVQVITDLAEDYTVAIYGDFFDNRVRQKLRRTANVTLFGGFHYSALPHICATFRVGLLPYLKERSHDGSPLKLYEYLRYRRPVITSMDYELTSAEFILNYKKNGLNSGALQRLLDLAGNERLDSLLKGEDYFEAPLRRIIDGIVEEITQK